VLTGTPEQGAPPDRSPGTLSDGRIDGPNLPDARARRAPIGAHAQSHLDALACPKPGP